MFDRSLTTSFLPLGATIQPRRALLVSSMTLSVIRSTQPALIASMPTSISSLSKAGRGKFCGWNVRPAHLPVREAPANCKVPRSRPSSFTELANAWYFDVEVVEAWSLLCSSSLTAGGVFSSFIRRSSVDFCKSGNVIPYSLSMYSSIASLCVADSTAPSVISAVCSAKRSRSMSMASKACLTSSVSTQKPRSLMIWSNCQWTCSVVMFQVGIAFLTCRMASTSSRAYSTNLAHSSGWVCLSARSSVRFLPSGLQNRRISRLPSLSLACSASTPNRSQSASSEPGKLWHIAMTIVSCHFSSGVSKPLNLSTLRSNIELCAMMVSACFSRLLISFPANQLPIPSLSVRSITWAGSSSQA